MCLVLIPLLLYFLCRVELNFGQREPWFKPPPGFEFIEQVPLHQRVRGMMAPAKVNDCEVGGNQLECVTHLLKSKKQNISGILSERL